MADLVPIETKRLPADRHPAAVYLKSLAVGSRRAMCQALDVTADVLTNGRASAADPEAPRRAVPWHRLRYQHAQAVRTVLAERYAPATANRIMSALRGALREAWRLGLMSAEDFHRAADLKRIKGDRVPKGRALAAGELRALFQAIADEPHETTRARDAAMLAVMYGGGPRRAEVVALDLADYDPESGRLLLRGKGNKEREMYAKNGAREALDAWLAVRGPEPGPLFVPIDKGGRIQLRRLTTQAIFDRCIHLGERAAIPSFSPHDLRRTFIGDLLDAGADLVTVQKMAGHANPATTARYDRRDDRAKQRAASLLVVPYVATERARSPQRTRLAPTH